MGKYPNLGESLSYYPQGYQPDAPSVFHPIHHISSHAAMFFAALFGCRLPSPKEWEMANKLYPNTENRNIRDKTWEAHKQHVVRLEKEHKVREFYSDINIFFPFEGPQKIGKDAEGDHRYNDGTLWFQYVNSMGNTGCSHLVGNVAEYVFEKSKVFDNTFYKNTTISAESVSEFIKQYAANIFVIGGSALSPLSMDISLPYPVETSNQRLGYSDVGMRLAFTAPIISLGDQVKAIFRQQNYILN